MDTFQSLIPADAMYSANPTGSLTNNVNGDGNHSVRSSGYHTKHKEKARKQMSKRFVSSHPLHPYLAGTGRQGCLLHKAQWRVLKAGKKVHQIEHDPALRCYATMDQETNPPNPQPRAVHSALACRSPGPKHTSKHDVWMLQRSDWSLVFCKICTGND